MPAGAAAGTVLAAADLAEAEVDLAEDFSAAVVEPQLAVGRTLAQHLKPGQTLRQTHLKAPPVVRRRRDRAGRRQRPRLRAESEGQALNNGIEGQPARVRTESGRVADRPAAGERRVEVAL